MTMKLEDIRADLEAHLAKLDLVPLQPPEVKLLECFLGFLMSRADTFTPPSAQAGDALEAFKRIKSRFGAKHHLSREQVDDDIDIIEAALSRMGGESTKYTAADDRIIREGFPDGWFVQDRLDQGIALLIKETPGLWPGSNCICLRPKSISTDKWIPTAQKLAQGFEATHPAPPAIEGQILTKDCWWCNGTGDYLADGRGCQSCMDTGRVPDRRAMRKAKKARDLHGGRG